MHIVTVPFAQYQREHEDAEMWVTKNCKSTVSVECIGGPLPTQRFISFHFDGKRPHGFSQGTETRLEEWRDEIQYAVDDQESYEDSNRDTSTDFTPPIAEWQFADSSEAMLFKLATFNAPAFV